MHGDADSKDPMESPAKGGFTPVSFNLTRSCLIRILASQPVISEEVLKLQVALQLYENEPSVVELIGEHLDSVSR